MELNQRNQAKSASLLKWIENESLFIKHEWEELVEKLSCSDDPKLRAIGIQECEAIKFKENGLKIFMN